MVCVNSKLFFFHMKNLTATTLIYANGARITVAAGTKFSLSNIIYNHVLCQIHLIFGTMTMSQTFGGGFGGGL